MFPILRPALTEPQLTDMTLTDFALEGADLKIDLVQELGTIKTMLSTVGDLVTLHESIETYGLVPQLLSFANSGNYLSSAIPGIPSLESMYAVTPSDADRDAALEGVAGAIADVLKRIKDHITGVMITLVREKRC